MKFGCMVCLLFGMAAPAVVRGQVGLAPEACLQAWGEPRGGSVNTNGYGKLRFKRGEISVDMDFVAGSAQNIAYRSDALSRKSVDQILEINRGDSEWHVFITPGRRPPGETSRRWIRADEMATARHDGNTVTVYGAKWLPYVAARLADPAAHETSDPKPVDDAEEPTAETPPEPANRADPLVGVWQCADAQPVLVLDVRADGRLFWHIHGRHERRKETLAWSKPSGTPGNPYMFAAGPEKASQHQVIAQAHLQQEGTLHLSAQSLPNRADTTLTVPGNGAVFRRIHRIPTWRPEAPGELPSVGDSRQDSIRLLGQPSGVMKAGNREALTYRWGTVWLVNGQVEKIEEL